VCDNNLITFDSLTCKYDKHLILDNISLHVKNHLSILGANGSGKSTFAKALCHLITFDGTITFNGKNSDSLTPLDLAKTITYIPAKLEVHDPYISVYEFILLGRFPYKKSFFEYSSSDNNYVDKNLKLLHIEHLKEHTIHSLSSGEQQLVLIAQALTQESRIIIFDEPTANLDPFNSKVIANHIKELKNSHQIILITHDLHLASYIDNPVVFISQQKVHFYEKNSLFFDEAILEKLYGVAFDTLAVKYE
jgi:iron complex transport system ATP-binding protein